MTTTAAIELDRVTKRYGDFTAVREVDLRIPTGAVYGLLGPNGAGKTTTIRMILGIIEPSSGGIRVLGSPFERGVLDRVGYLPEERGVYKRMTVRRLLAFLAELKGVSRRESQPRIERWLERMELTEWRDAKLQELSKGMQQKIQFISTVLHEPEVVILDEPFSGLDPINQKVLREIIADLRREGRTILFSTHIIEHAERICDHVAIIARGAKVVDGTVAEVKREHGQRHVALVPESGDPVAALRGSAHVEEVREPGTGAHTADAAPGVTTVTLSNGGDAHALLVELVGKGVRLRRFELVEPTLEQVFIERVGNPAGHVTESPREVAHV